MSIERSIVIVDDDLAIRQLLSLRFALVPGVRLAGEAENGREALELVRRSAPDLVILDLRMPVMGGAEAIPLLRAIAPGIRIVVHSSLVTDEDLSGARCADAVVLKDGDLPQLVAVVQTLLEGVASGPRPERTQPWRGTASDDRRRS